MSLIKPLDLYSSLQKVQEMEEHDRYMEMKVDKSKIHK